MSDNAKIVEVVRFIFKTCVQGTNYTKGDYNPEETHFWVKTSNGEDFETTREKILSFFPDRKNITGNLLELLKGKDADRLK
ncbi:MAG: hypothetical protein KBT67_11940 [bacterium]|nr:hypothetical protein [Candidatus Limimorpha caballi]